MVKSSAYFSPSQLKLVCRARDRAATLVSNYYCVAPREWQRMPYEIKTLRTLDSSEITDLALAQTICYGFRREAGPVVLDEGDLFRICLQDHRILNLARDAEMALEALLTYVLTHELIHVVRFGQRMQRIDLPCELRLEEEQRVEQTTQVILKKIDDPGINRLLSSRLALS